jgi:hypothetical protein
MDFPTGFPGHLEAKVDAAIAKAEVSFLKAKANARFWSNSTAEELIKKYVRPIFIAFAYQACRAVEEASPGWNHERVRRDLIRYLRDLVLYAWNGKHPEPRSSGHLEKFQEGLMRELLDSKDWLKIQRELGRVARKRSKVPSEVLDSTMKTLGARLNEITVLKGISHEELANRIGISRSAYFEVKGGHGGAKSKAKAELYLSHLSSETSRKNTD